MSRSLGALLTELGVTDASDVVLDRVSLVGIGHSSAAARQDARRRATEPLQWTAKAGAISLGVDDDEAALLLNAGAQREE
ncbi:hypothetical protein Mx9_p09 [Myxococcus phage Mx9]|nr:hypothetical protein Mx9_p09 [Myxococcus phage Mx9]